MGLILNNSSSIEKLFLENETFSLKYTLISNDKIFIMNQYLKEARFCENVFYIYFFINNLFNLYFSYWGKN